MILYLKTCVCVCVCVNANGVPQAQRECGVCDVRAEIQVNHDKGLLSISLAVPCFRVLLPAAQSVSWIGARPVSLGDRLSSKWYYSSEHGYLQQELRRRVTGKE